MTKKYSNNSISSLKGPDQVRKRPAVIFGTDDKNGCANSIFEIIANAIDEVREGYGKKIDITVSNEGVITVKDFGRGVPMDWNELEKEFNWKLVFCQMYASGKYSEDSYEESLGLNGLGATATQYASEFMEVTSVRDDKTYFIRFEKGFPIGELKVTPSNGASTGTTISFKPDREVFTNVDVDVYYYLDKLRRVAMLHAGLIFSIKYKDMQEIILQYPKGSSGFIDELCERGMLNDTIVFEGTDTGSDEEGSSREYTVKMSLAINFSRETHFVEMYHNGSYLKDASENATDIAIRSGILKVVEELLKSQGQLAKSDKINIRDIEELLVVVGSTSSPGSLTSWKNQTKTAVLNNFLYFAYAKFVYGSLSRWASENRTQMARVLNEIMANKKAREEADAVKKKVLRKLSSSIDTLGGVPEKFVECRSKNPMQRELYIVEGDSAKGSCKLARNSDFQAIMPVRGKILNCLKEDITRILNSEIITDLIKVLGCGIELESKHIKDLPKFDISKLNWNKIIICTDADLDGMQIRCLILTMIYRLMPSLLKAGKVFIAETPLFELTAGKKIEFAYSDKEREEVVARLVEGGFKESSIKIGRSKGLGENEPEMMALTTMNPNTRRLIPVLYDENDQTTHDIINALLGDDLESRRYLIDEYFDMEIDID